MAVRNYDEALAFYVGKLGIDLVEDIRQPDQDKRGSPFGRAERPAMPPPFARAAGEHQARFVGDQAGGRVFLLLATDDFARDHAAYRRGWNGLAR